MASECDDMFADDTEPVQPSTTAHTHSVNTQPAPLHSASNDSGVRNNKRTLPSAQDTLVAANDSMGNNSIKRSKSTDASEDKGPRTSMEGTRCVPVPVDANREFCDKYSKQHHSIKRLSANCVADAYTIIQDGRTDTNSPVRVSFGGVFDGHGGRSAAFHAAQHLHDDVMEAGLAAAIAALGDKQSESAKPQLLDGKAARSAIISGFKQTDAQILQTAAAEGWQDGATAVCAWVVHETVMVAHIGDAKAVLARAPEGPAGAPPDPDGQRAAGGAAGGATLKAILLTKEHKATQEVARITKAGGRVIDGRLEQRLEVSRAFGDTMFKGKGLICTPDVVAFTSTARDRFLLLACDGFWNVFGAQDAVNFAQQQLEQGKDVKGVCNRLLNEAIRVRRCKDNCTVMMVKFGA